MPQCLTFVALDPTNPDLAYLVSCWLLAMKSPVEMCPMERILLARHTCLDLVGDAAISC